jgi:hypothetical protein
VLYDGSGCLCQQCATNAGIFSSTKEAMRGVCVCACLFVCLSMAQSVCESVCLPACLLVCPV